MIDHSRFLYSLADQLLLERGEFDPIAFLLDAGFVDEDEHRAWRDGACDTLQSALVCEVIEAVTALAAMQKYLAKQKLALEIRSPLSWTQLTKALKVGSSRELTELCSACWERPANRMQSDLFQDTSQVVASSAVKQQLADGQIDAAREALARMREIGGSSADSDAYQFLIDAAKASHGTPAEQLREIEIRVAPLAQKILGERARDYLALPWQALARRLSKSAFNPDTPKLHASYCNLQARRYKRVAEIIEAEAGWECQAILVARLAESYSRLGKKSEARKAWSQLCWRHPDHAERALGTAHGDLVLAKRWQEFTALDVDLTPQAFPAWLLIADLRQREYVPMECAPDNEVGTIYCATFNLAASNGELGARAALNELHPELLRQFIARRSGAG